ncbi:uncharacterized protein TM35_000043660 [Trypanosoma theileri]|uniref:Uncharacterized protein n=1 Tax=Trypanosoma theileri TaxID=67003 RepID=A0A1X0P5E3_9TRYP|nr:uncharacterized protein TM35_000043660 [Trypanosoma theileri]ORC92152.1 hypothetical protein TM35_000043660 [Trypanosoma theileri]
MQRSSSDMMKTTMCIVAGGVGVLFSSLVYRRWRSSLSSKKGEASLEQHSNHKHHNPQEDETNESQDVKINEKTTRAVPVEVIASELPVGWRAPPVVFQPPMLAVLPLTPPAAGDCFIICEGPLPRVENSDSFFLRYLQSQRLFNIVAAKGESVVPLEKMGLSHTSGCFTHIIVNPDEEMSIVLGCNGPYVHSLVITGLKLISEDKEKKKNTSENILKLSDLQILLNACRLVPLVDEFRFPDTPVGVREGRLRVTCSNSNYIAVFAVPTTISVKSVVSESSKNNKNDESLFVLEGDVLPGGKITIDATIIDSLVKGDTIDTLFPNKDSGYSPVSSFLTLVSVQELVRRSPKDDTNIMNTINTTNSSTSQVQLSTKKEEEEEDRVNVAFSHLQLGVSFSVNPHSGIVHEPVLTDDLLALYYPLGDGETSSFSSEKKTTTENVVVDVPPCAVIRRLTQIPPTWEKYLSTDDELKHNVLFHFTDWVNERVSSSICELNGIRCVQMNEEKEGHSCRSYIIPFAHGILVIRWETKSSEWELHLPHLQKILDTLHLIDPTV